MSAPDSPHLIRLFLRVLRARAGIVAAFLVLSALGAYGAARIPEDSAIDRLVVAGDPIAQATEAFEQVFPEGDQALILLEAPDPFAAPVLMAAQQLEQALSKVPHVEARSLLDLYRRGGAAAPIDTAEAARIRRFATGTTLFHRAGLVGPHEIGIALELHVGSPAERDRTLDAIDAIVLPLERVRGPVTAVRRVGDPWLEAWLERQTTTATRRFMPLFGLFLMALVLVVYRSLRTLGAIVLTLGSVVAIGVGIAFLFGWPHTVVSTLVPLTVMVTTTATLVYIHSRYMEVEDWTPNDAVALSSDRAPTGTTQEKYAHARALANKFLPCTASMFATAVGFAALAVSDIRPVRQMGLWTACGLIAAWAGCFTLFPALQSLLRAPRRTRRVTAGQRYSAFVDWLVPASRRHRVAFVAGAVALMLCGAAALLGVPGRIAPLSLETDALTYVDPHEQVAKDTRYFEQNNGLDVIDLWVQTAPGHALDPPFLRAIDEFTQKLASDPRFSAVDGPTSVLRWERYISSGSDQLPNSPEAWQKLADDLGQILLTQPAARQYVDVTNLASVRLSLRAKGERFGPSGAMRRYIDAAWKSAQQSSPALAAARGRIVGKGALSGDITERLLPTLMESFAITASVIFCAFLVVFRSPAARLMTMIPSLFAILSVFIVMRATGIPLNIATILIGSTVLGATENDQIHFFYHFQEARTSNRMSTALRHAFLVAGRPIVFATLINASGFLALALSNLPPMRQFGIVSSTAFLLALLADFTALPGALWLLDRSRNAPPPGAHTSPS